MGEPHLESTAFRRSVLSSVVAATHSSKRFARVVCCLGKSSSSPPALRAKAELTTSWAQQFLLHTTTIACSEGQTQFLSLDQTCLSPNFDCATLLPKFSDEHKQSWRNTIETTLLWGPTIPITMPLRIVGAIKNHRHSEHMQLLEGQMREEEAGTWQIS